MQERDDAGGAPVPSGGRLSSLFREAQSGKSAFSGVSAAKAFVNKSRAGSKKEGPSTPQTMPLLARERNSPTTRAISPQHHHHHTMTAAALATSAAITMSTKIYLNHLTVEGTIRLRNVYDSFVQIEGSALPSSSLGNEFQTTVARPLDIFHVTTLLHRCSDDFAVLPPLSELKKILTRVTVANGKMVAQPSLLPSAPHAVEAVVEYPSALTFEIFLQIAELVMRWVARENEDDEVEKAFASLSRNKHNIKPMSSDDAAQWQSGGAIPQLAAAIASRNPALLQVNSANSMMLSAGSSALNPSLFDEQGRDVPSTAPVGHLSTKHLQEILRNVGADYDFDTLFGSVDPTYEDHKGGKIDQRLFRWVAGSDDPDVVKAFVALGGEEALSGTITVDKLIAKCEAMQMTPQYIANFISIVDANQDGVVDFTEFLAMLVRNRQELSGDRRQKISDRNGKRTSSLGAIKSTFSNLAPMGPQADGGGSPASSLPFPRRKRFSKNDGDAPSGARRQSIPFQGLDDGEGEVEEQTKERQLFQETVRSMFEVPDVITLEDDVESKNSSDGDKDDHTEKNEKREPSQRTTGGASSSSESSDSDNEEERRKARLMKKKMSMRDNHLGIGLTGMLQHSKSDKKERSAPLTLFERIELTCRRGAETVAQHRGKSDLVIADLEKRQRKFIRTDDGLVEGTKEGTRENPFQQRQRLRLEREKRNDNRQTSARVAVLSQKTVDKLKNDVEGLLRARDEVTAKATAPSTPRATTPRAVTDRSATPRGERRSVSPRRYAEPSSTSPIPLKPTPLDLNEVRSQVHSVHPPQARKANTKPDQISRVPLPPNREQMTAAPRPLSHASRPSTPAQMSRGISPLPLARQHSPSQPPADRVNSPAQSSKKSTIAEDYQKVKLEDPQALWKLLQLNQQRLERAYDLSPDHSTKGRIEIQANHLQRPAWDKGPADASALSTRRVFARIIASHLALRLPSDEVSGWSVPTYTHDSTITSLSRNTQKRTPSATSRPASQQQRSYTSMGKDSTSLRDTAPRNSNETKSSEQRPHRPSTAPSQRRPLSATTVRRQEQHKQLTKATNRSPIDAHGLDAGMACSPLEVKHFGIGGLNDIEEEFPEDENDEMIPI